jgi:hypothetical protein
MVEQPGAPVAKLKFAGLIPGQTLQTRVKLMMVRDVAEFGERLDLS